MNNKSTIATILGIGLLALAKKGSASNVIPIGFKNQYDFQISIKCYSQAVGDAIVKYTQTISCLGQIRTNLKASNGSLGIITDTYWFPLIRPTEIIKIKTLKMGDAILKYTPNKVVDNGSPLSKLFLRTLGPTVNAWTVTIPFTFEPNNKPLTELLYNEYQKRPTLPSIKILDAIEDNKIVHTLKKRPNSYTKVIPHSGAYFFALLNDIIGTGVILNRNLNRFILHFPAKDLITASKTEIKPLSKGSLAYDEHEDKANLANSIINKFKRNNQEITFENYRESYEKALPQKIDSQDLNYNIGWGDNIGWKDEIYSGDGALIPIKKDDFGYIRSRDHNIYDPKKLAEMATIVKKLKQQERYALFDPAYVFPEYIGLDEIKEHFEYLSDGEDPKLTTGDDDLDSYLKDREAWAMDNSLYYLGDSSDIPIDEALELYQLAKDPTVQKQLFVQQENQLWEPDEDEIIEQVRKTIFLNELKDLEESDIESLIGEVEQVVEMEEELLKAQEEGYGDIGKIGYQLRDGHHRTFGAIAGGESGVWVYLPKDYAQFLKKSNFERRTGKYIGPKNNVAHNLLEPRY